MTGYSIGAGVGIVVISLYWAISLALAGLWPRPASKEQFLAAGRRLGTVESAFSIAATWIWAPALFLATQKAYTQGLAGVFWFTAPNVLCLILFAPFAARLRRLAPRGFTLSGYMRERFSSRVQGVYLVEMGGLAACSFAVQLLAGGKVLSFLTGLDFFRLALALAAIALSYSLLGGLKSSVVTDYMQMVIILLVGGVCLVWVLAASGGWETVRAGLGGRSGDLAEIFGPAGRRVAWSFGLPVTIGLLAGPFGDQSFYQRAFAVNEKGVWKAFVIGALIFALVPLMMACLGFVAAGRGWDVPDASLVNLEVVARLLPGWMMIPFVVMLLSGLISTLDSNLCAVSALMGHDMVNRGTGGRETDHRAVIRASRLGMVLLALAGLAAANIPGMEILYLFLFYGTLRASTLLPTVLVFLKRSISEAGLFYGVLASILVGLPVFAYGNFTGRVGWTIAGSLITVLTSGAVTLAASMADRR